MVKKDVIAKIVEVTGKKKQEIEEILNTLDDIILETVSKGEDVKVGLGIFKRQETKGRSGVSKLGGVEKEWKTEDGFKPVFKPSKAFKDAIVK